ncbi:hypothetical protein B0T20DRAFT_356848, partial [Sordaria brevicollis]
FFEYYYFVYVYINDIIIFNKSEKEYLTYLQIVFNIINEYYIYIGANKSFIKYLSIKFLKYIINKEGISKINN